MTSFYLGRGGSGGVPPPPNKNTSCLQIILAPHLCPNLDSFSKLLSGTLFPGENVFPAAAAEEPAVL